MNQPYPRGDGPHSTTSKEQDAALTNERCVGSESAIEKSSPRQNLALWIGILGSAAIWLVQLQTSYALVLWACATHKHWVMYVVSALFLIFAAVPGWIAWSQMQQQGSGEAQSSGIGRKRFMATLGLMLSALFTLLIAAQAIPIFFVDPCLQ